MEIHSITTKLHSTNTLAISVIYPYNEIQRYFPNFDQLLIKVNDPNLFSTEQRRFYLELQKKLNQIIALSIGDYNSNLKITILLLQILDILISHFTKIKEDYSQNNQKNFVIERLQVITGYIQDHFREKLTLEKIASNAHISKEYMSRFFKENMGITVGQYIKKIRAQHVYKELSDQRITLTQIAIQNGFSDLHSMNRALIFIYGKNAHEIRKALIK